MATTIGERVKALEAKETYLATKSDISSVRTDIANFKVWLLAILIAIAGSAIAIDKYLDVAPANSTGKEADSE